MPRTCTICRHFEQRTIERALISGQPLRSIADHFGVAKTSLIRHRKHLSRSLLRAKEIKKATDADSILANVCSIQAKAKRILEKAEESGNYRIALSAIREIRGIVELLARMAGKLREGPTVNFIISPEYRRLRAALTTALTPFPEARLAVAKALRGLEDVGS